MFVQELNFFTSFCNINYTGKQNFKKFFSYMEINITYRCLGAESKNDNKIFD